MKKTLKQYDKPLTIFVLSLVFAGISAMCSGNNLNGADVLFHLLKVASPGVVLGVWVAIGERIKGKQEHLINESYLVLLFGMAYIYSKIAYFPGGHAELTTGTYIIGALILIGIIVVESIVHVRRNGNRDND